MRVATETVSLAEIERQELAPQRDPLFQLAQLRLLEPTPNSGWPTRSIGRSFSAGVSMFASSRTSSSNSTLMLCASSTTSAVITPRPRVSRSAISSSSSRTVFDRDALELKFRLRASSSRNSCRVRAGLLTQTARTCRQRSDERAA